MGAARKRSAAAGRSPFRRRLLLAGLLAAVVGLTAQAVRIQALEHATWQARAQAQHVDRVVVPAPRGTIYDRNGVPLAATRERFRINIAPRELTDPAAAAAALRTYAGLSRSAARRVVDRERRWVTLRGVYDEDVRDALAPIQGIHIQSVLERFYPYGDLAREILGPVGSDGAALGGIELEFDSILSGRAGLDVVRSAPTGRPIPGLMLRAVEPVPGEDVYLTFDRDLQEIAEDALTQALDSTHAQGGDVLLMDPRTGEVLAAVSRGGNAPAPNWRGVTVPYEPGSTLKPFTVAALLQERLAALTDSFYGEKGVYRQGNRTVTDVHEFGWLTLADALRFSSNVGMAKASERLPEALQYRYLRDFGFGTPTGIAYPSESGGRLHPLSEWTSASRTSLAIGYEIAVTPLQMALAYSTLANGGMLMEPRLVREVRSRDGEVDRTYEPRPVRRVLRADVARRLREVLIGAVEVGTGRNAAMGPFEVGGKTGTARVAGHGGYIPGAYTATFAGFFPGRNPQLVFVVKLDRPAGSYYAATVAAPVTRATLEAALAARNTMLDKSALATPAYPFASGPPPGLEPPPRGVVGAASDRRAFSGPIVLTASDGASAAAAAAVRPVPGVTGLPLRDAALRLHDAGFRVRIEGGGIVMRTIPEAGVAARAGRVIRVVGAETIR